MPKVSYDTENIDFFLKKKSHIVALRAKAVLVWM